MRPARLPIPFPALLVAAGPAVALAALLAGACSDEALPPGSDERDGGDLGTRPDAAVAPRDAEPPVAVARFAHLAPDLGAVDICYRAAGTSTFLGPLLDGGTRGARRDAGADASAAVDASDLDAGDAGASPGLEHRSVTKYLPLERSGPLEVAIVPAGSSCASPLLVRTVTLDPGKLGTVVLLGRTGADAGASELGLVAFVDDRETSPEKARVRFVHAALPSSGDPLPLGIRAVAGKALVLADRVDPRKATAPSSTIPVDELGYATVAPVPPPASLAVSAAAPGPGDASLESWQSEPLDLELRGGSLHTGFLLLGEGKPLEVVWCRDTSTTGDLTTCVRVR